ncbi:MAG: hypothetical protein ACR2N6_07245 [Miltoncostaeaceae bacterium]
MTTASGQETLRRLWSRGRLATRYLTAIVLATIAGGVVWLTTLSLFKEAGFEPVDFARELALGLGVEGRRQTVGVAGLGATLAAFLGITLFHAAIVEPLIARRGAGSSEAPPHLLRFGPAALLILAVAGFVAAPIMGIGVLGLSESFSTTVAFGIATVAAAICLVRVYTLVVSPRWWEHKDEGVQHAFAEEPRGALLELSEQGSEEGPDGSRREAGSRGP